MATKVRFDVTNRYMELLEPPVNGVASIDLRVDVYSDGKEDWEINANGERAHRFPFVTSQTAGGPTTGGRTEPIFFRQRNGVEGWRILPYDADHTLFINGTLVPQDAAQSLIAPRPGRTILAITDGSEVAGLTQGNALSTQQQSLLDQIAYLDQRVFINTELASTGDGSARSPFNTWTAGVDYAEANNLKMLMLMADANVDRQLRNFVIEGIGNPTIDLDSQDLTGTTIERATITGTAGTGGVNGVEVSLLNVNNLAGIFLTVGVVGVIEVAPGANLLISRVAPLIPAQPWTLSMNSGQASVAAVHNISGGMIVTNMDDAGDILHLHFSQGELTINASCTAGTIVVTGEVEIINNGVGVTVDSTGVIAPKQIREPWQLAGLDIANPAQNRDSRRLVPGLIDLDIDDDGTTSTVTRQ